MEGGAFKLSVVSISIPWVFELRSMHKFRNSFGRVL